jgi:hypothetical protein
LNPQIDEKAADGLRVNRIPGGRGSSLKPGMEVGKPKSVLRLVVSISTTGRLRLI